MTTIIEECIDKNVDGSGHGLRETKTTVTTHISRLRLEPNIS